MHFQYTLTKDEYVKGVLAQSGANEKFSNKILSLIAGSLIILGSSILLFFEGFPEKYFALLIGIIVVFADPVLRAFTVKAHEGFYERNKDFYFKEARITFTDEGFLDETKENGVYAWAKINKYLVDQTNILLYLTPDIALIIPKRVFVDESQYNSFTAMLKDKVKEQVKQKTTGNRVIKVFQVCVLLWILLVGLIHLLIRFFLW